MLTITLKLGKTKPIWQGHPWVFPKAIASIDPKASVGDLVRVEDEKRNFIGAGVFNPHSLYRVRLLAYADEEVDHHSLEAIVTYRFNQAKRLRETLGLPNETTNGYRFFNSEGDYLSGLTIDIYEDVAVVSSSAYWVELQREMIQTILKKCLPLSFIIWQSQKKALSQDGFDVLDDQKPTSTTRCINLSGVKYDMNFQDMQKTGLFLDQRENHQKIAAYCAGKKVLDLYSYVGGFALSASKAGASQVTAIDSSQRAIDWAQRNANLNNMNNITFICDDVSHHVKLAADHDVIILDPPKLVPSRQHLAKAMQHYQHLHRSVFSKMKKNSLLFTCNCSAAMSWDLFLDMLRESAAKAGRHIQCLEKMNAAKDHPTLPAFPEGEYLRAVLLRVL